jgi:hypothetical protein
MDQPVHTAEVDEGAEGRNAGHFPLTPLTDLQSGQSFAATALTLLAWHERWTRAPARSLLRRGRG